MIAARQQYSYLARKQLALKRSPDCCSSIFTHGLKCRRRSSRIEIPSLHPSMPEDYVKHSRYIRTSLLHTIQGLMGSQKEPISGWNSSSGAFAKTRIIGTSGCHLQSSHIINGHMKQRRRPHLILSWDSHQGWTGWESAMCLQ